ncbi:MAG: 1-phosphofructokinase family hexose kinase [Saprospiraceae bacterium]|nr:1-phosphofructokinase family hexose kinase [Saprospiraceae bacterium]
MTDATSGYESKIITVTFSPCLDKSTSVSALVPDKKLKCASPIVEPGGGGINVSRVLKKLGSDSTAVYLSGGYTGKYFDKLLADEQIKCLIIPTAQETRENIIIFDDSSKKQYRLGMPGNEVAESEFRRCLSEIASIKYLDYIVASGSLPPGVPSDIFARLAVIAKDKGAKLIVDTSGLPLKSAIDTGVFLIKPNIDELGTLTGKENISIENVEAVAKILLNQNKCQVIVVSMGPEGAILVTKEKSYRVKPPPVEKKSTVGAGDSMVAGLVFSLSTGKDLEYALQFGVACGTAATMNPGTELCHKSDVYQLLDIIRGY